MESSVCHTSWRFTNRALEQRRSGGPSWQRKYEASYRRQVVFLGQPACGLLHYVLTGLLTAVWVCDWKAAFFQSVQLYAIMMSYILRTAPSPC